MKKVLQISILRARKSVSEMAVGAGPRGACPGGSGHELAQLRVLDLRGERRCLRVDLRRYDESFARGAGFALGGPSGLRYRADAEAQLFRGGGPGEFAEPLLDLGRQPVELESPRRRARRNVQGAVASDTKGPRFSRDRLPHRFWPRRRDLGEGERSPPAGS